MHLCTLYILYNVHSMLASFYYRLLLREDENEVLKEMLRLTQQEKLQDMKLLQNLLHETRQTFNNVLKNA